MRPQPLTSPPQGSGHFIFHFSAAIYRVLTALALFAALLPLTACDTEPATPRNLPPWGEVTWPATPTVDPIRADLGRLLFYDPVLGSDGETACATCHSELWGMSDGLPTSIGVGGGSLTGPGRKGGAVGTRNAQALWNVVWRPELFWDGRETSLENQALFPMHSPLELAREPDAVVAELNSIDEYVTLFAAAFGDPEPDTNSVTVDRLKNALAEFERTLIADRTSYDRWVAGDAGAMTDEMVRGMELFAALDCTRCHVPPTFESNTYHARIATADPGRSTITNRASDHGAMRTPTLRNIRMSEPYFHNGSVASLEDAVRLEVAHTGETLTPDELQAMLAFLGRALVDRSREPFRPAHVPSGLPVPIDGFRILRP
jgi:cytochrome c peroxidase